ncbi:hypothetical protein [Streptomonospora litoralis]|uniref:Uncharacterized protein n=1 Tax=Streptomonospora litoralis TaxID=2498135 RepID=A0A4P6PWT8_9ACTN|nr:hypothetical protein [Streptomonospora litoralis]QBI52648.1 hypothetical protein EKD16_04190 [Streptomonospora litoralis]
MLLYELVNLQRDVDERRERQRRRLSARRLRAELRERRRAERLLMELPWSRLC